MTGAERAASGDWKALHSVQGSRGAITLSATGSSPISGSLDFASVFVKIAAITILGCAVTAATPNDYADPATWLCLPERDDAWAVDLSSTILG